MVRLHDPQLDYNTFKTSPHLQNERASTQQSEHDQKSLEKHTFYCPIVKETIQQDSVIWDVLDNPLCNYLSYIFPVLYCPTASGYLFSFGANRLNYWWWKLHGWGNGLPWLHGSFGDRLKPKGLHAIRRTVATALRDERPLELEMTPVSLATTVTYYIMTLQHVTLRWLTGCLPPNTVTRVLKQA